MNILIVDDQPIDLKLLSAILESEGHTVAHAADGIEALEVLESSGADVIISDILMPRMDGYRLCGKVRKSARLKNVPFIIYSATYTSLADEELSHDVGADFFLRKPAGSEAIVAALQLVTREAGRLRPEQFNSMPEGEVMREYSERLVGKLKQGNAALARKEEEVKQLNTDLERRVMERTAQLEASVKELDAFSYSISHDLRAPLRAMDGYARILEEDYNDQLDDEGRRVLGVIRSESQRMDELINELLTFSRLGRQEIKSCNVDMKALAEAAYEEARAAEPDRTTRVQIAELPAAHGEPLLLRQVWTNLISNALKFTRRSKEPRIEVGALRENGEMVYFVRDNGAGFDMRYIDKLFGVFQRLHLQDEFEGTGVGLAFVKRIVERHGGQVWAEGAVGKGATFSFALPDLTKAGTSTSTGAPSKVLLPDRFAGDQPGNLHQLGCETPL